MEVDVWAGKKGGSGVEEEAARWDNLSMGSGVGVL